MPRCVAAAVLSTTGWVNRELGLALVLSSALSAVWMVDVDITKN